MSPMTAPATAPQLQHTVVYDPDWRILSLADVYTLEFRDPCMRRWHEMYRSSTEGECEDAYDAYHEGEEPVENEFWS